MKKLRIILVSFLILFVSLNLLGQTYLYIDDIVVSPVFPTTNDIISITVSGNMSSTNVIVQNEQVVLSGNNITLSFQVSFSGMGLTVLVPYNHTFIIGPVSEGDYFIGLTGDFVGDYVPASDKEFYVEVSNTNCQSDFIYYLDTINPPPLSADLIQFEDLSIGNNIVSWFWDFGDGNTSTIQNPLHAYFNMISADYIVCLTITTSNNCISTFCDTVTIGNPLPYCVTNFDFSVDTLVNCLNCYDFYDYSFSSGGIISWFWDFDDGTYSVEQNPIHMFSGPGEYNVCLIIVTDENCQSFYCDSLIIPNFITSGCDAEFQYVLNPSPIPEVFISNFFDISNVDTTIVSWLWDFGDGNFSNDQNPVHSYWISNWGLNIVCLTIITADSCTSSYCELVYVGYDPCMLSMSYSVTPASFPGSNDGSIDIIPMGGNPPYQYFWSNGETTEDIYNLASGNYVIWLVDSYGCSFNEIVYVDELLVSVDSQIIVLSTGWSSFSTFIDPFSPNIEDVLSLLADTVILVKDGNGVVYWPTYNVNAIGDINLGEGFQIKMSAGGDYVLIIFGLAAIPELIPINLVVGWSLIGYLRQSSMNIADAFSSVIAPPNTNGDLIIVKSWSGDIYWPYFNINSIGTISPGEAYLIKMASLSVIYYPPN